MNGGDRPKTDRERWEAMHPGQPWIEKREGHWLSNIPDTYKAMVVLMLTFLAGGGVITAFANQIRLPPRVAAVEARVVILEMAEQDRRGIDEAKLTMLVFLACREDQRIRPDTVCPHPPRWWEVLTATGTAASVMPVPTPRPSPERPSLSRP